MALNEQFKSLKIEDHKYDIFFIYKTNPETSSWIKNTYKDLERMNIVVGYHEKDFSPGRKIPECTITCFNQSKHVGIVITPDFCRSRWCRYDMHAALMKVIKSTECRILPLFLNLTNFDEEVPQELQMYIGLDVNGPRELWFDKLVSTIKYSNKGSAQTMHYHFQKLTEAIYDADIETAIYFSDILSRSHIGYVQSQIGTSFVQKIALSSCGIYFENKTVKFDFAQLFPSGAGNSKIWSLRSVFNKMSMESSLQVYLTCSRNEELEKKNDEKSFTSECEMKFYGIDGVDYMKLSLAIAKSQEIHFSHKEDKVLSISNENTKSVVRRLSQSECYLHLRSKRSQKIKRRFPTQRLLVHRTRGCKNYRNYRKVLFKFPGNNISGRYTFYRDSFRSHNRSRQTQHIMDNEAFLLVQKFEHSHKALIF